MIHLQEPGFQIKFLWLSGKNLSSAEMLPLSASSDVLTTKGKGKTMSCFLSPPVQLDTLDKSQRQHWYKHDLDLQPLTDPGYHCGSAVE